MANTNVICNGHVNIPKEFLDMCEKNLRLEAPSREQYYYFFDTSTKSLMIAKDNIETPKLPNLCLGVCKLNLETGYLDFPNNVQAFLGNCKKVAFLTNPSRNRIYIIQCPS